MRVVFEGEQPKFYKLDLRLGDVDLILVNGLCRVLMSEVPCFAIHDIVGYKNTRTVVDGLKDMLPFH